MKTPNKFTTVEVLSNLQFANNTILPSDVEDLAVEFFEDAFQRDNVIESFSVFGGDLFKWIKESPEDIPFVSFVVEQTYIAEYKRKRAARKPTYIVYDATTNQIVETFSWYGNDIRKFLKTNKNYVCINRTHPMSKEILTQLKQKAETK